MPKVAGIDSSTQSCKVVVCDAETGDVLAERSSPHPDGTECPPQAWWTALQDAGDGLLDDVAAVGVAGQQHGMVTLDDKGEEVRPALLWNDTRSAGAAVELIEKLGGPKAWAEATGSVPVASMTVTKLAWLAAHEPANADRVASVMLPHDYLTWQLCDRPAQTSHRPRRRVRHALLVAGDRRLPPRPAGARIRSYAETAEGARPVRSGWCIRFRRRRVGRHRRQHGRGTRAGRRGR